MQAMVVSQADKEQGGQADGEDEDERERGDTFPDWRRDAIWHSQ